MLNSEYMHQTCSKWKTINYKYVLIVLETYNNKKSSVAMTTESKLKYFT